MITLGQPVMAIRIELPGGVSFCLARPVDGVMTQAALSWARARMAEVESTDPHLRVAEDVVAVAAGFARYLCEGWEGVLETGGAPAAFTDDNLLAFFRAVPGAAKAFTAKVVEPLDRLESEGNG